MADRWLGIELRGRTWYAVKKVPPALQVALGTKGRRKRHLVKSLETRDRHLALAKRYAAHAEFEAILAAARAPEQGAMITEAAMTWRDTLARLHRGDTSAFRTNYPGGPIAAAEGLIIEEADEIEITHGPITAAQFAGLAFGTMTPLLLHLDAWLREGGTRGRAAERTQSQYRADVQRFHDWLAAAGLPTSVEAISKAIVGRYISETMVATGMKPTTANRRISAVSAYWRWMQKRAGIESSPWGNASLSKVRPAHLGDAKPRRAFTDEEVSTLLAGDADPELADIIRMALLTGARLAELAALRVQDCTGGWLNIRASKSHAGIRRVPIHSALTAIVDRRCEGRAAVDRLFKANSPSLSKRFTRYRQRCGVHEQVEGDRQASAVFHSARHWFISKAVNAGFQIELAAKIAGQEYKADASGVTAGIYLDLSDDTKRQCVESVKLPA